MNDEEPSSTIIVVDQRSFEVRTQRRSPESSLLTVVADGRQQWTFDVPGWRAWSCGASWGDFYIWTARQLIVFASSAREPITICADEDLLFIFKVDLGWLAVCETSVRLLAEQGELDRIECGDVIETARWDSGRLIVSEQSGARIAVTVKAGELAIDPPDGQ